MRERWPRIGLAAVVSQIPFELQYTLLGLSNLQWTFIALVVVSIPLLLDNWRGLKSDRLVQAVMLFTAVQWLAVWYAPEYQDNALKAAIRFTAGLLLLMIVQSGGHPKSVSRVWVITSAIAAIYALSAYAGFGVPWLFRNEEFYIGQVRRLSGSFEYPNTAAAYFAMSLPIVWWSSFRPALKRVFGFFLWCAVVLTFSKGALIAVPMVVLAAAVFARSNTERWRTSAGLIGIGIAAYVVLLPVNPYLFERFRRPGAQNPLAAEYRTPWNRLQQQPGVDDDLPLQIRNTGVTKWRSQGWWRVAIGCRWWDMESETFLKQRPLITELPRDVDPGEIVEMSSRLRTPEQPGKYVIVVELFSGDSDWFSQTGVVPTLIQADIQASAPRTIGETDLSYLYRRGKTANSLTASVPRSSLWSAALKMFMEHPLGVGPDNYRLQYGKYLGASRWDTQIYSNSLYLELLTGSGIPGLVAFGVALISMRWRADGPCLAVAVFLVHGLVDVFLMTTPIYFAFWLLLGAPPSDMATIELAGTAKT